MRRGISPTVVAFVLSLSCAAHADTYPEPPFDFASAPFPDRPPLFNPIDGVRPVDLLVIFVELDGFDYTGRGVVYLGDRVFGDAAAGTGANSIKEYVRRASHGRAELRPATESNGIVNDGIVIVDAGALSDAGLSGIQWRRLAVDLADPYVDYDRYDTGDGQLAKSELQILVILGNDNGEGQEGGLADRGRRLDGIAFEDYSLPLVGGPTGSFITWVHELHHAIYNHRIFTASR